MTDFIPPDLRTDLRPDLRPDLRTDQAARSKNFSEANNTASGTQSTPNKPDAPDAQSASDDEQFSSSDTAASTSTIFSQTADIKFSGTGWELFRIYAVNVLLIIVTLGVYYFWAKTRIREYLWTKTTFLGEPFEYLGTGWELFRSFLFFASLFFVFTLFLALISFFFDAVYLVSGLGVQLIGLVIWPYAMFCALRFRLTRTCWRGIHGQLAGSAISYTRKTWVRYALILLTAGLYLPHATAFWTNYLVNNASFGSLKFRFENETSKLSRPYYACWLTGVICLFFFGGVTAWIFNGPLKQDPISGILFLFLLMPLALICLGLPYIIYQVIKLNWLINGLHLDEASLKSEITIGGYLKLTISNGLLVLFTMRLGAPWAIIRRYKFLANHIRVCGKIDWSKISQTQGVQLKGSEGLLNYLDFDLGF